jgi:hypothetical protein
MPTWGEILRELQQTSVGGNRPTDFDGVRRKYIAILHQHLGRNIISYSSKWTQPDPTVNPEVISVSDEDMEGLMETVHGLTGTSVDLILHSPGGSAEAAEGLISYLRSKFTDLRIIVPHAAMSAATMMCCGADRIVMGKHSFLGPIDPQFILNTPLGLRPVPAQAILDQFAKAKDECKDPGNLPAWLPMLGQFGPGLLVQCDNALRMSKDVVLHWLQRYMFAEEAQAEQKATEIANWLASHERFKSHGRHIMRDQLEAKGMRIEHLESDQNVQDLVLSAFHATMHTFNATPAVKIIENHLGKSWLKMSFTQVAMAPGQAAPGQPTPMPGQPQPLDTPMKQG